MFLQLYLSWLDFYWHLLILLYGSTHAPVSTFLQLNNFWKRCCPSGSNCGFLQLLHYPNCYICVHRIWKCQGDFLKCFSYSCCSSCIIASWSNWKYIGIWYWCILFWKSGGCWNDGFVEGDWTCMTCPVQMDTQRHYLLCYFTVYCHILKVTLYYGLLNNFFISK